MFPTNILEVQSTKMLAKYNSCLISLYSIVLDSVTFYIINKTLLLLIFYLKIYIKLYMTRTKLKIWIKRFTLLIY